VWSLEAEVPQTPPTRNKTSFGFQVAHWYVIKYVGRSPFGHSSIEKSY
jgi:hypothetical protein